MDMGALVMAVLVRWWRIALVTLVLLVGTYVVLKFVPKLYESSAGLLVEARDNAFTRATNEILPSSGVADDAAIASQVELIKSRGTLLQVVDLEDLRSISEFNGGQTSLIGTIRQLLLGASTQPKNIDEIVLAKLADRLTVARERDSQVISVRFRSTDPERAANIANAIANVHVQRRAQLYITDTADASQWLLIEIEKLRTTTAEAEARVASYRVENDLFVGDNNTSLLDQQLSDISAQITAAQERENTARSRSALIRGLLEAGQPIDGVQDVRESVVVQRLSEDKAGLQGERAQLLATLLPNHPNILALSAEISEIDKQITIEGRQVASALEAEAKIEAGLETSLRDDLTRLKIQVSAATKDTVTLNGLEREAKAQRDLLETYLLRYRDAAARTDSNSALPDVRVVITAAAAIKPASPKTKFILAAVFVSSIMLQLGYILFAELVSGRALTGNTGTSFHQVQNDAPSNFAPSQPVRSHTPVPERKPTILRRGNQSRASADKNLMRISEQFTRDGAKLILVASADNWSNPHEAVEILSASLVSAGRSVVEIDAGSRNITNDLGLSDLCSGNATFGDVVHRGRRSDYALVPWGRQSSVNFTSPRCATLVTALEDVFEIVIVEIGRIGVASALPSFAGMGGVVLLTVTSRSDRARVQLIHEDVAALGFEDVQIVELATDHSKVA